MATARTGAVRAVQMEALADVDQPAKITLTGVDGPVEIAVKAPRRWRLSALDALTDGDFKTWAKGALASETDVDNFFTADPEIADLEEFMKQLNEATSEGKSTTSSPSTPRSRRTAKK